jgi:rubredoxin
MYKCPNCSWVGKQSDMGADYTYDLCEDGSPDYANENWICPSCNTWHQDIDEYEVIPNV